ncbi:hypothetical protein KEM54_004007 [Ascosphaera aggregata]|nr:hypothetical protein KEM54_004007 [Ascosphaera aggregata]
MRFNPNLAFLTGSALGIVGITLSIYSWSRASKLSLPISGSLPAFSTFIPLILAILTPLVSLLQRQQQSAARPSPNHSSLSSFPYSFVPSISTVLTFIDGLLTALPAIVAALSATYFTPDGIATCRLDSQWQRFWRDKNDDAIRGIQDQLKCCGYRTLTILSSRQFGTAGQVRRGNLRQPVFTRTFGNSISAPRATPALPASESTPFTGERYTDNEAEERLTGESSEGQPAQTAQAEQAQLGQESEANPRPATSHSSENPEEHDILHGGFRDSAGR